jgi:hypothetical protein
MSEIFTLKQATKELKMSRQWLMGKIKEKKIKVIRLGGKIFINCKEMERIKKEGIE